MSQSRTVHVTQFPHSRLYAPAVWRRRAVLVRSTVKACRPSVRHIRPRIHDHSRICYVFTFNSCFEPSEQAASLLLLGIFGWSDGRNRNELHGERGRRLTFYTGPRGSASKQNQSARNQGCPSGIGVQKSASSRKSQIALDVRLLPGEAGTLSIR
ncbi:unnamed protein product [Rangifer tarandus platyrhynchus]|uniref:Uncharacterized protein n=1 Tax=Rangifer tarandus platyrhynchus TaxID=3082113 RepID=A0ABN8XM90_RANTA|nr:unnamed protein product [Rangifer tarandus platyrhynchus]